MLRQVIASGLLYGLGRDPIGYADRQRMNRVANQTPAAQLEADGLSDAPAVYLDDSTARAARRLLQFHFPTMTFEGERCPQLET
jgi:hypothetical protein